MRSQDIFSTEKSPSVFDLFEDFLYCVHRFDENDGRENILKAVVHN